jgi:hypothetical protein
MSTKQNYVDTIKKIKTLKSKGINFRSILKRTFLIAGKSKPVRILQIKPIFLRNISAGINIPADADKFVLYKNVKNLLKYEYL